MTETTNKTPTKSETTTPERSTSMQSWAPVESLRREVDRLFENFDRGSWGFPFRRPVFDIEPFWRREAVLGAPVVDIVEKDQAYEMSAELPGMTEKDIEVTFSNGDLLLKGEKREEREEQGKDFRLKERRFGAFERRFTLPQGIDADKIDASFKNGVLTVVIPKRPEAIHAEKKIEVKGV